VLIDEDWNLPNDHAFDYYDKNTSNVETISKLKEALASDLGDTHWIVEYEPAQPDGDDLTTAPSPSLEIWTASKDFNAPGTTNHRIVLQRQSYSIMFWKVNVESALRMRFDVNGTFKDASRIDFTGNNCYWGIYTQPCN
jgi:hypothetical protein